MSANSVGEETATPPRINELGNDTVSAAAGETNESRHPTQQAQPERELGSLCSSLQAAASAANNDLREYLLAHADQRASIVPLSRELVDVQTATRLYIRRCSVVDVGPDESATDSLPRPVLDRLVMVVHKMGHLVSHVMNLLEDTSGRSIARGHVALSPEQLVTRLGRVTTAANMCTAALNIGLDAMAMAPSLQPAAQATETTELPAYQSTQLLQDTLSLRLRMSNLSDEDQSELPTTLASVSEFLDELQSHMDSGSNSLLVPPISHIADIHADTTHSRSDSSSLRSDARNGPGLLHPPVAEAMHTGQQSPAYDSVRVEHPAPSSVSMSHITRKPSMEGEILSVAFVTKNGQQYVVANNMATPTRFFAVEGSSAFLASYGGGQMTFPPETSGTAHWAFLTDEDPWNSQATATLWQHDGTDYRKPLLCVGDYVLNKRHQKLRIWGARPLCFSPDGQRLAVVNGRHRIAFLDAAHSFGLRADGVVTSHTDEVTHAVFTHDSHALVSVSRDGTVRLTDPLNFESLGKFDTGTWKRPSMVAVTPDSNVVVSVWGDLVYRWNHTTGAVDSYALGSRRVREGWPVALSPDCRFLLCRNEEGADISDAHSGRLLFTVRFNMGFLTAAAFSADSRYVALCKSVQCLGPRVHQSSIDVWRLDF